MYYLLLFVKYIQLFIFTVYKIIISNYYFHSQTNNKLHNEKLKKQKVSGLLSPSVK